jgi:hypothetical protein
MLAINKFDSAVYEQTDRFLSILKRYYGNKLTTAADEKDRRVSELTRTPEQRRAFERERLDYANDAVSDAVLNVTGIERIVEYDGLLVQKIYPIYMEEHDPDHFFDFSANLYQPTKHFGGVYWNTLYFNIVVIWSMTLLLFVTLYFDVLKRIVRRLEGSRRFKRKPKE